MNQRSHATSSVQRAYRALLLVYPSDVRRRFGDEMHQLFLDDWQAGAYMTIVTVVLYLAHMAFVSLPEHYDGTHDDPPRGDKSWQLS